MTAARGGVRRAPQRSMPMRNLVLALGLLSAAGAAVTSVAVAQGRQDTETIRVYKSPT